MLGTWKLFLILWANENDNQTFDQKWGDATACPYNHFEECVQGNMSRWQAAHYIYDDIHVAATRDIFDDIHIAENSDRILRQDL